MNLQPLLARLTAHEQQVAAGAERLREEITELTDRLREAEAAMPSAVTSGNAAPAAQAQKGASTTGPASLSASKVWNRPTDSNTSC